MATMIKRPTEKKLSVETNGVPDSMAATAKPAVSKPQTVLQTTMAKVETKAASGLRRAATSSGNLVKKHPLASAGAMLGAGVLIGVAAQRAFRHKPTVGEVVMDAIRERASKISRSTSRGFRSARASARRAIK